MTRRISHTPRDAPPAMPTTAPRNYLDPQALAAIGPLELRARMIVEGLMTGMHRSPFQGFSVEFAQHRQYTPGDDVRYLDWKVFGRTNKLYLKQYQKETNLDLVILVDVSGSMAYASPQQNNWRKFDHAAALAAAMAFMALRQQDRVGLVTFSDRMLNVSRMSNAHDHWRAISEALTAAEPKPVTQLNAEPAAAPTTDLSRAFDQVLAKVSRRSLVILISDLFDSVESLEQAMARLHHRRHDLIVLQTLDPAERTFPFRAAADFIGLENDGKVGLDPAAIRKGYLAALDAHLRRVEDLTRRFRFDHLLLDTSENLGPPLSHFLAKRSAVINKGK